MVVVSPLKASSRSLVSGLATPLTLAVVLAIRAAIEESITMQIRESVWVAL